MCTPLKPLGVAWTGVLVLLVGCGRLGFDSAITSDASGDVEARDGAIDTLGVGKFGTPQSITELNADARYTDDPSLTADELMMSFTTSRTGADSCDLWTATRVAIEAPWSTPVALPGSVDGPGCQATSAVGRDGLSIWYAKNSGSGWDLYVAQRPSRADPFAAGSLVPGLSSTSDDVSPTLTADGLLVVFESSRGTSKDLYTSSRRDLGSPWTAPKVISELSTPAAERSPHISPDGCTLWFVSDRGASSDLFVATRASATAPFTPAMRVDELSSADTEDDPWVSDDGHRIYFARYDLAGTGRLYVATR